MDFVVSLPRTEQGHDAIQIIVDRLVKSVHLLPIHGTDTTDKLSHHYMDEIGRLYGVSLSIVTYGDPKLTSRLQRSYQAKLGTYICLSIACHPHTDGKSVRVIQFLEEIFRSCTLDFSGNRKKHLALVESVYNNNYLASIDMALYEALYGRRVDHHCAGGRQVSREY